jgi:hypothetical protein
MVDALGLARVERQLASKISGMVELVATNITRNDEA